ncbi:gTP-binding protein TypA [Prevotella sp. CAG:1124]|nr:gTP-binding protein TypA [Prevotella sp. CAG:1124]
MQNIRNIAIIAHVDHGKTTLVDKMMLAGNLFRDGQDLSGQVLDSNDLERERGITILSKNVSINWKGTKINIIDTPGHSDFGGEVERVLNMADGCLLLVDAFEGPMPQTRFVLQKALQIGLKPIVVVNKVDKPNCRPEEVYEMVFDLMFSLNATEDQLDFPVVYGSAKNGWMGEDYKVPTDNINYLLDKIALNATEDQLDFPVVYGSAKNGWMGEDYKVPTDNINYLLDKIVEVIPAPKALEGTPQMLITSLDYSSYTGRIAVGRVHRGTLTEGMNVTICHRDGSQEKTKIKELHTFEGMGHVKTPSVSSGDICAIIGLEKFEIGDTICDFENPEPLPPIAIDEPTMSMLFTINDSPFFGKEGKYVTSRHINDRLQKELEKNLALRVAPFGDSTDKWIVSGRGVLHLSVLIETMRREGYELQVGQPQVIYKEIDGQKCEPIEELTINVPEEFASKMIDMVTRRKGEMTSMESQADRVNIEFDIPSRGIIGLRTNVLTASQGEAIMAHRFKEYQPYKGDITRRINGSMIAMETGTAYAYSIDKLQDRGKFFIDPGDEVYAGEVVGEHVHDNDLVVNVTKAKQLTNTRASGSDDKARIVPRTVLSLEEALEYIKEDELVEVTPKSMRMRKIILDHNDRKRANKQ